MKKFTHAWLAMMAMKRIEKADIPERQKDDAKALVKWFKNYRDFVISGAWYPDEVIKDMGVSHIVKYTSDANSTDRSFRLMHPTLRLYQMGQDSPRKSMPFTITMGNLCDRCEALTHGLIDNFKILYYEGVGSPISPLNNHIAMKFFMLSHYIADAHMPLHCDARQFATKDSPNQVHAYIEEQWDKKVADSYEIDKDNNRFFYDPEGYPLKKELDPIMAYVEEELEKRPFIWSWGPEPGKKDTAPTCKNTWDYMSGVTQYSYLMAYRLVPDDKTPMSITPAYYRSTAAYKEHFEEYSEIILADAVESIAKIWLHAWVRYRDWWRGCEIASLKKTAGDAEDALAAAKDIIANIETMAAPLKAKYDSALEKAAAKKADYDAQVAKGKSLTKVEAALEKANAAVEAAKANLDDLYATFEDAKANLQILEANKLSSSVAYSTRLKEYAKYEDKNSNI